MEETTSEPIEDSRDHGFPCENCGAAMSWDPVADALGCEYCGHVVTVPRAEGEVLERPLAAARDVARGLGLEVRVARCDGCGASVTYDGATTSERCVYCGEPTVLAQEANRNAIRPESLIPLDIGADQVRLSFQKWIRGLWFRPNALKKVARYDAVGIYVPFWSFDCRVHSDWSADSGTYYYVSVPYTTTVNGKTVTRTRRERRVRWRPAWGARDDVYDDLLVLASPSLPADMVAQLDSYDTDALVPYRPEYLAGWRAEEYRIDLEQGWVRGRESVVEFQRQRCAGDVPGDTHRNLRVTNDISDVRWKHVLLPLWSLQYRFRKKTYTVLVHGQNGRIVGDAPYSWVKITLLVLALAAVALGVIAVANR